LVGEPTNVKGKTADAYRERLGRSGFTVCLRQFFVEKIIQKEEGKDLRDEK